MPRSTLAPPLALSLVLLLPAGCGGAEEAEPTASPRVAPFRDDIELPSVRNAVPWQPPANGPAPVVEVLRDGSWFLDGKSVDGDPRGERAADADLRLKTWLAEEAGLDGLKIPCGPLREFLDSCREGVDAAATDSDR